MSAAEGLDRAELLARTDAYGRAFPTQRRGQALFNVAYSMDPSVARLTRSDVDPFYNDAKIEAFLDRVCAPPVAPQGDPITRPAQPEE